MSADHQFDDQLGPPLFRATLRPHRSLSERGILVVTIIAGTLALIPGLTFFLMGAWPIVGFMGLDILLLYWALTRSKRGEKQYEEIGLWHDAIRIRKVDIKGRIKEIELNPFWARLVTKLNAENEVESLHLIARQQRISLGEFLNPADRTSFARTFGQELSRAKR